MICTPASITPNQLRYEDTTIEMICSPHSITLNQLRYEDTTIEMNWELAGVDHLPRVVGGSRSLG